MCNFMGVRVSQLEFIQLKQIEKVLGTTAAVQELERMKDGFRYSNSAILRKSGENDFEIVSAHWELIPYWVKDWDQVKEERKKGFPWLNATAEKLLTSKMFRPSALKRRCLVLASNFYEWRWFKPEGEKKEISYPYSIEIDGANYFYMAGIWQPWTDKTTGETIDTFAIVTTVANSFMAQIHNRKKRMPTILTDDLSWKWMMEDLSEYEIQEIASFQIPSSQMKANTISKNFKVLEEPCDEVAYPELPELIYE